MSVAQLDESPVIPLLGLGPYRAAAYAGLPDEPRCELIEFDIEGFWQEFDRRTK